MSARFLGLIVIPIHGSAICRSAVCLAACFAVGGLLTLSSSSTLKGPALAPTVRVSTATGGMEGDDRSENAVITPDGRFIAFESRATNLVAGDTNGFIDVFLHDRMTGETRRVSVASDGTQGNGHSGKIHEAPAISSDGRYVAFASFAGNLVPGDSNNALDLFIHDVQTGVTVRSSLSFNGTQGASFSAGPAFSASARYLAFYSDSALALDDTNQAADVYVLDRDADNNTIFDEPGGTFLVRVSVASDQTQGNRHAQLETPGISADGRHVVFVSDASNLVPLDGNNRYDAFVHDRDADGDGVFDEAGAIRTIRVSTATDGTEGNGECGDASISADGRFIAFESASDNLVPGDLVRCGAAYSCSDIFVHNRDPDGNGIFDEEFSTQTFMVSTTPGGQQADSASHDPKISTDGEHVAFVSYATNLIPGATSSLARVYVRDWQADQIDLVSVTELFGPANDASHAASISADGRIVAFHSKATNLVGGDTNQFEDVFVHDRAVPTPTATPLPTPSPTLTPLPPPTVLPVPTGSDWRIQTLEVRGGVGDHASIALDSQNRPHISYFSDQGTQGALKYATWDGAAWHAEVVDDRTRSSGRLSTIALDGNGNPVVAYFSAPPAEIKLARRSGSAWQIETVVAGGDIGHSISMTLEPTSGLAQIAYYDGGNNRRLVHAAEQGGVGWTLRVIDDSANVGLDSSLAYDIDGQLHVSYHDLDNLDLKIADYDFNSQSWAPFVVDPTGNTGRFTSLGYAPDGTGHVSYFDVGDTALKHASNFGGGWSLDPIIDNTADVGQFSSLAFDLNRGVIAYRGGNRLLLARQQGGFSWTGEVVDPNVGVGSIDLAIGTDLVPQIAYFDAPFGDLKYASFAPAWRLLPVSAGIFNFRPSLELHHSSPAVSFHRGPDESGAVIYSAWNGSVFAESLNRPVGTVSYESSLARDAVGRPSVAFYDASVRALFFAAFVDSQWQESQLAQLAESEEIGDDLAVFLGGPGGVIPHLVYTIWGNTSQEIILARLESGAWQFWPLTVTMNPSAVVDLSAGMLADGSVAVSYFEDSAGELRLATWSAGIWTDEYVDGSPTARVGQFNSLAVGVEAENGGLRNSIAVAYYAPEAQSIKYAFKESTWTYLTVIEDADQINGLSLALSDRTLLRPRIAYGVLDDASLRVAWADDPLRPWTVQLVPAGGPQPILFGAGPAPSDVDLAFDGRPRLAYRSAFGALTYSFPTAGDVAPAPIHDSAGGGVGAILGFDGQECLNFSDPDKKLGAVPSVLELPFAKAVSGAPLGDQFVIQALTGLFAQTPDGQDWIDRYFNHAAELARIGFTDPALLWDCYRAMQNFMPGLQALVTGRGNEVIVTQEMAGVAADIWRRFADAAEPQLASFISLELLRYEDLQEFVGMTFDEWARAIGVLPPTGVRASAKYR